MARTGHLETEGGKARRAGDAPTLSRNASTESFDQALGFIGNQDVHEQEPDGRKQFATLLTYAQTALKSWITENELASKKIEDLLAQAVISHKERRGKTKQTKRRHIPVSASEAPSDNQRSWGVGTGEINDSLLGYDETAVQNLLIQFASTHPDHPLTSRIAALLEISKRTIPEVISFQTPKVLYELETGETVETIDHFLYKADKLDCLIEILNLTLQTLQSDYLNLPVANQLSQLLTLTIFAYQNILADQRQSMVDAERRLRVLALLSLLSTAAMLTGACGPSTPTPVSSLDLAGRLGPGVSGCSVFDAPPTTHPDLAVRYINTPTTPYALLNNGQPLGEDNFPVLLAALQAMKVPAGTLDDAAFEEVSLNAAKILIKARLNTALEAHLLAAPFSAEGAAVTWAENARLNGDALIDALTNGDKMATLQFLDYSGDVVDLQAAFGAMINNGMARTQSPILAVLNGNYPGTYSVVAVDTASSVPSMILQVVTGIGENEKVLFIKIEALDRALNTAEAMKWATRNGLRVSRNTTGTLILKNGATFGVSVGEAVPGIPATTLLDTHLGSSLTLSQLQSIADQLRDITKVIRSDAASQLRTNSAGVATVVRDLHGGNLIINLQGDNAVVTIVDMNFREVRLNGGGEFYGAAQVMRRMGDDFLYLLQDLAQPMIDGATNPAEKAQFIQVLKTLSAQLRESQLGLVIDLEDLKAGKPIQIILEGQNEVKLGTIDIEPGGKAIINPGPTAGVADDITANAASSATKSVYRVGVFSAQELAFFMKALEFAGIAWNFYDAYKIYEKFRYGQPETDTNYYLLRRDALTRDGGIQGAKFLIGQSTINLNHLNATIYGVSSTAAMTVNPDGTVSLATHDFQLCDDGTLVAGPAFVEVVGRNFTLLGDFTPDESVLKLKSPYEVMTIIDQVRSYIDSGDIAGLLRMSDRRSQKDFRLAFTADGQVWVLAGVKQVFRNLATLQPLDASLQYIVLPGEIPFEPGAFANHPHQEDHGFYMFGIGMTVTAADLFIHGP